MKRLLFICLLLPVLFIRAQTGMFFGSDRLTSTLIVDICQDKTGYIWIATEYGLNRFDGHRFTHYLHADGDSTSLGHNVTVSLLCDNGGNLWVGTLRGLQRYDAATDCFVNYYFPNGIKPRVADLIQSIDGDVMVGTSGYGLFTVQKGSCYLKPHADYQVNEEDLYFSHIYESPDGSFWKSGAGRFTCRQKGGRPQMLSFRSTVPTGFFDYQGTTVCVCIDKFTAYCGGEAVECPIDISEAPEKCNFYSVTQGRDGNIYVGTDGNGLFWIPAGSNRLQHYPGTVSGVNLQSSKVWDMLEDRDGNVWVGCQQKGLVMIPNRVTQFSTWSFAAQKQDIGTFVSSVCQGDGGVVWCAVENQGVYGFDSLGVIVAHPQSPSGLDYLYRDNIGDYWLGTRHGLYAYNPQNGSSHLLSDFDCQEFNCIADDGKGHVAVSAFSKGMLVYDRSTAQFRHFSMNGNDDGRGKLLNDWIMTLMADHDGIVWIGTTDGVACFDAETENFRPLGWDSICKGMFCTVLCETQRHDVLIGTLKGLYVWHRESNKVEPFKGGEQLANLVISYIVEDNTGDLWCSTSMGIWHYEQATRQWASYMSGPGLAGREYVNSIGMHTADDHIYFATGDGITTFTPQQVKSVKVEPKELLLTNFYIGGNAVSTLTQSNGHQVTSQPVSQSNHFTVSYLDNAITLEFSMLNYADASNTVIEHRLNEGEWLVGDIGRNSIELNHLASGTYVLEVRAREGGIVSPSRIITIEVLSPWYRTTIAYIIYILALLAILGLIAFVWLRHVRLSAEEDKMKFLINATHDIRSPLTLIMGGIGKLKKVRIEECKSDTELSNLKSQISNPVDTIDRNAQRILNLVNHILDVRKIDKQQMRLHCQQTDLKDLLQVNCKFYEFTARERGITLSLKADDDVPMVWVDRSQIDKVVTNLLSNAFKYCYDMGEITVRLTQGHNDRTRSPLKHYVEISVIDTGTGMREGTLQHLFDRFYQGANDKAAHTEGTGIGLNLCKMIVDMHHGSITGRNREDGIKGSIFTVRLPQGNSHLSEEEIDYHKEDATSIKLKGKQKASTAYRILVVDDDEEIPRYISQELGQYYHFTMCRNGKDGLRELLTNGYDLVISDVMMPEMDGFTMLRMIRTNGQVNHLPVIILSSKTDIGNRLEGLERGADAYLTKPFSIEELHATIDNIIDLRQRLRGKFSGKQSASEQIKVKEVKGNDEQLMERIIDCINLHISDSDFTAEMLAAEVGISRANMHRKMKAMTGITATDFMRNIRMEQAVRLLMEQKVNVTQVAYSVGYASLPYFSTAFKKHFGLSPTEYIEKHVGHA